VDVIILFPNNLDLVLENTDIKYHVRTLSVKNLLEKGESSLHHGYNGEVK
jgi:hypothetical protein